MSRIGRQTPTTSVVLPYSETKGQEAIDLYNSTTRTAREWQELLTYDLLAVNEDGLWVHAKFGYEVPRRNGKGEILAIREMYGLVMGEQILHTAHRTPTSHSAWERLCRLLDETGLEYKSTKQFGLETIRLEDGGNINFRTRTSSGGLGEGYDLLVIDEAQEYTIDQESTLQYVVTDSENPQTLLCGTPPTAISSGTVFTELRNTVLNGQGIDTGWAEWSVEHKTDVNDMEALYETNPSLGCGLSERAVRQENKQNELDYNIQRFGLWVKYNQKSAISRNEWEELKIKTLPGLRGKLHVGIKYGHNGKNVSMSIACRTDSDRVFVESIDCRPIRAGNTWIIDFIASADIENIVVDGANGQQLLIDDMKEAKLGKPVLPTVKEIIVANAGFEQAVFDGKICHMNQPSLSQVISNCEKRPIGSNGGFGYKALNEDMSITLMDSVILAHWSCIKSKEKKKQRISY